MASSYTLKDYGVKLQYLFCVFLQKNIFYKLLKYFSCGSNFAVLSNFRCNIIIYGTFLYYQNVIYVIQDEPKNMTNFKCNFSHDPNMITGLQFQFLHYYAISINDK